MALEGQAVELPHIAGENSLFADLTGWKPFVWRVKPVSSVQPGIIAVISLHDKLALDVWIAGDFMAAGVWRHLTESPAQTEQALK